MDNAHWLLASGQLTIVPDLDDAQERIWVASAGGHTGRGVDIEEALVELIGALIAALWHEGKI